MKVVLDTMLWVSYCTRRQGSRHRLIERAARAKVPFFVSDYTGPGPWLEQKMLNPTLIDELNNIQEGRHELICCPIPA